MNLFQVKEKFVTNVYWEKTFRSLSTNFNRLIPETYIIGFISPCFSHASVCAPILGNSIMK